jgi:hypothetical protein
MPRAALLCLVLVFGSLLLGIAGSGRPSTFIGGEVRDAQGPVVGARVRFQGQPNSVITDLYGRFQLPGRPDEPKWITASKEGHYIGGMRAGRRTLLFNISALPTEDFDKYSWVDPHPDPSAHGNCANCHAAIHEEWSASAHAGSAKNRHFLSMYAGSNWRGDPGHGWSLRDEYPDGVGVCTACHAPTAPHGDPAYFELTEVRGVAAQGVHCDYCHKITDAGLGTIGLTHGRFGLQLMRPAHGQLFFGPLDDVDRGEDAYSPLYRDSRYCASCHEGVVFGVHVYGTYSEWLDSPARTEGKHCQTCHMVPTGRMTNIAPGHGGIPRNPQTLGNHRFFTGSQLDMLRHALSLSVSTRRENQSVRIDVELRADDVGHRVPTGFVDRQLMLWIEPLEAEGNRLPVISGPILPQQAGHIQAGQPGRIFGRLLADGDGHSPVPFWRADDGHTLDTRLIPGRTERASWLVAGEAAAVRARLVHRRTWDAVAREKDWPDNEIIVFDKSVRIP